MSNSNLTDEQIKLLEQPLDPKRFKTRAGGGGSTLTYLAGFDIIETANRIFGPGSWGYDIVSNEPQNVLDDQGQIVGTYYAARVKLQVYGCLPVTEEGTCAVQNARNPRALIDAHDMARKGAITDAMKRAFRCFGNQFGNPLYDKDFASSDNIDHSETKPQARPAQTNQGQQNRPQPTQAAPQAPRAVTPPTPSTPIKVSAPATPQPEKVEMVSDKEIAQIAKLAGSKGIDEISLATRSVQLYGKPIDKLELTEARHFYRVLQEAK